MQPSALGGLPQFLDAGGSPGRPMTAGFLEVSKGQREPSKLSTEIVRSVIVDV